MQEWYVWRSDEVAEGPHDFERLKVLWQQGALGVEGKVRAGAQGDWVPAASVLPGMAPTARADTDWAALRFRGTRAEPGMPDLPVEDDGWQQTRPAPWRRYFGRAFDTMLFMSVGGAVLANLLAAGFPGAYEAVFAERKGVFLGGLLYIVVFQALVVFGNALLLGLTGTTPGKWLFGTRVTHRDGRPIGPWAALRRELSVLLTGQGLGLPIIALAGSLSDRPHDWSALQHCAFVVSLNRQLQKLPAARRAAMIRYVGLQ